MPSRTEGDDAAGAAEGRDLRGAGRGRRVVVVGAGAFGGWTALHLRRAGCEVTLVDPWGPGNTRASSGGETRVLRHLYAEPEYVTLVRRAVSLWREHEARWGTTLLEPTGLVWMVSGDDDSYERQVLDTARDLDLPVEELDRDELARRFPAVDLDGVRWALVDPDAGPLRARRACRLVAEQLEAEGGRQVLGAARPLPEAGGDAAGGALGALTLEDGGTLEADVFVLAAGPWLGRLAPGVAPVTSTRQQVTWFGLPPGDRAHAGLPVWADRGERFWYGHPDHEGRGFKIADDTRGPEFDPTDGDRRASAEDVDRARGFLARRFPALADAPVLETRVCQYEESPDGHYLLGRHPRLADVWILGGGSGHGYKLGPSLGELTAAAVLGEADVPHLFSLERLAS